MTETTHEALVRQTNTAEELLTYFQGARDSIDQAVAQALVSIPEIYRLFHVDAAIGNDEAAGDLAAPLATFGEAIERTPRGGIVEVRLHGNYVIDKIIGLHGRQIFLLGDADGTSILSPTHENLLESTDFAPGFNFDGKAGFNSIRMQGLTISLPAEASSINVNRRGLVHASNTGFVRLHECDVLVPVGCNRSIYSPGGFDILQVTSTTTPIEMPGHWLSNVAAGTDPATLPMLATNLTSL